MIYTPIKGSRLSEEQAQRYGESISKLVELGDGRVSPKVIVDDARNSSSPLHDFFVWDNDLAAEKYRLEQASYLLRSIQVTVKHDDTKTEIRAFHNVVVKITDDVSERTYIQIDRALNEEELYQQILEQAMKTLENWKRKYQQYKEFADVIKAIDNLQWI